jgi:hypothetical protein
MVQREMRAKQEEKLAAGKASMYVGMIREEKI